MKSDHSTPATLPKYTRTDYKGKKYVALGEWTREEMLAAIKKS